MTCADILARTLRDAGVTRMFGLPGGEILDFVEAARRVGIAFLLTRHEATAAFMADVSGQIRRRPGVCVSTLGPGAVNMTLGVANAFLDRSPLLAITASLSTEARPYATHQELDLNAVYRPFTKLAITLDSEETEAKVREAIEMAVAPRMGPVHIAVPSDVGRREERTGKAELPPSRAVRASASLAEAEGGGGKFGATARGDGPPQASPRTDIEGVADLIARARRPVVIVGLDVNPRTDTDHVRRFVDRFGAPVFVTPKAKGIVPEDHPLFAGVCAGVAGDHVIVDFLGRSDLLLGVGFEPVESDKLWHHTMPLASVGPVSIAEGAFTPRAEAVGDLTTTLEAFTARTWGPWAWERGAAERLRGDLDAVLRPATRPHRGLSPYELTRALRELVPRDTVLATDVGSIKSITSQAWTTYEPLTFFESNGLSAMSYSFPAAMAARLELPDRPILCTIGDGGFGMTIAELETCVRERLHFLTIVYNDSALSLIDVAQQNRGYPTTGVKYGEVDFAAVAAGFGAWSRRVTRMEELAGAVKDGLAADRPAVVDVLVDPAEYPAHHPPKKK